MSDRVLPLNLAGIGITLRRSPMHDVQIATALSGKEYRLSWAWEPRYSYELTVPVAKLTEGEVAYFADFISTHFGSLDSFLISDPMDCSVTAHGFGVGDDSTTDFQLQRSMLGDYYTALGGPFTKRSIPRTNYCLYSADLSQASWVITDASCSGTYVPDGTLNDSAKVTATGDNATIVQTLADVPTGNQTLSLWMRGTAPAIKIGLHTTNSSAITLTSTWTHYSLSITDGIATSAITIGADGSLDNGQVVEVWGMQVEADTASTEYIPTDDAAETTEVLYWPNYQDGFEPIYEPIVTGIYKDAVLQTSGLDIEPYGIVSFDDAPSEGEVLTWSGSYYRRVRLAENQQTSNQIVQGLWEYGSIKLISIIP